ncbi:hypothetical protein B0T21DRAFT_372565 [Apiosordaria backusii]|uniref:Uncharacterized protein n=1 Tax=Apiosordaria backusii TaxID=314023 RepID=A0AA40AXL8_9PEZI|nr:hypothetical protein B0T21DRAFT_372565 [Apiosordaria backusii]
MLISRSFASSSHFIAIPSRRWWFLYFTSKFNLHKLYSSRLPFTRHSFTMRCSLSLLALGITTISSTLLTPDSSSGQIINRDSYHPKIDHFALHSAVRRFNAAQQEQLQNLTSTLPVVLIPRQASNLQVFTSALGGATAPAITNSGDPDRPFAVDGDTFPDFETASNRACDNQKNACAKIANEGGQREGELTVGECDRQMEQCKSAALSAATRSFDGGQQQGGGGQGGQAPPPESVLVSSDENFDFFCDV